MRSTARGQWHNMGALAHLDATTDRTAVTHSLPALTTGGLSVDLARNRKREPYFGSTKSWKNLLCRDSRLSSAAFRLAMRHIFFDFLWGCRCVCSVLLVGWGRLAGSWPFVLLVCLLQSSEMLHAHLTLRRSAQRTKLARLRSCTQAEPPSVAVERP